MAAQPRPANVLPRYRNCKKKAKKKDWTKKQLKKCTKKAKLLPV